MIMFSVKFDPYDEPLKYFSTFEEAEEYCKKYDDSGYIIEEIEVE